jgi:hypothetical protein
MWFTCGMEAPFTTDELQSLFDIEVMAPSKGTIRAQCQRCNGSMTREGSLALYNLMEMFIQHSYSCTMQSVSVDA